MKKILFALSFLAIQTCHAQYVEKIIYTITKNYGDENLIKNTGNIATSFRFDSIGCNWNMPTENDYLRFKILHFYIINERKEGEHWKKLYAGQKNALYETFDRYMTGKLKKKPFKISTEFEKTDYTFKMIFFDVSKNIQYEDYEAICQFVESKTGKVVLEYHIKIKTKDAVGTFSGLSIAMSNFFKSNF